MRNKIFYHILSGCLCLSLHSAAQETYPNTLLWEISGKGMEHSSYLFGTFHINRDEVYDVNDSVLAKLVSCEGFANEFNADSLSALFESIDFESVRTRVGKRVRDLLTKDEIKRLDTHLRKKRKIKLDHLEYMTAEEVYMEVSSFAFEGGTQNTMLDGWLYGIAKNHRKSIYGLEDLMESYLALSAEPKEDMRAALISIMDSSAELLGMEDTLLAAYRKQDLNAIQRIVSSYGTEHERDLLLISRNHGMAANMDSIMRIHSCFFAVGTAHLPGEEGLIDLMRKAGYDVKPVMAPKTGYYKKFVIESNQEWPKFTDMESGYSVDMPGKPGIFPVDMMKMNGYYDLGTGKIYLAMGIAAPPKPGGDKETFDNLADRYAQGGKVKNKRSIVYKGFEGMDMDIESEAIEMRLRVLRRASMIYIFAAGGQPHEGSTVGDHSRYFNSVELFSPVNNYKDFVSDSGAFSIHVPGDFRLSGTSFLPAVHSHTYSTTDAARGIVISVAYHEYNEGKYFNDLEQLYSAAGETFGAILGDTSYTRIEEDFLGYPAVRVNIASEEHGYGDVVWVLRESRFYTVIAVCNDSTGRDQAKAVLSSFRFLPYMPSHFQSFTSPRNDFRIEMGTKVFDGRDKEKEDALERRAMLDSLAAVEAAAKAAEGEEEEDPEEVDVQNMIEELQYGSFGDKDTSTHNYYSIDPATGASFNVISEEYSKYYHSAKKDSAFFRQLVNAVASIDSVLNFENGRSDTVPWCRALVEFDKNKGYRAHYKLVLNGRTLYTLCCFQPPTPAGDSIANRFFNSFTLLHPQQPAIFTSTLEPLLVEMQKADSAQMEKLLPDLRRYEADSTEKQILEKAFSWKFPDDTSSEENIRYKLYDKYYDVLGDSMAAARYVLQHYEELDNEPRLRILALSKLASTTDELCYRKLKEWLLRDRPYARYSVYTIFSNFYRDSIALSKTLYPELLTLASDSNFTEPVYYTTYRLLDIGVLERSDVEPGRPALQKEILAEIDRVAPGKRGTTEYFETLEGMLRLLNYFDDDTVILANKNIVSRGIYSCYADAVKYLARHNVQAEEKYMKKCLAKPEYRIDVYNALDTAGKSEWYPEQYRDQKYFAEADLYGYYMGEDWYQPDQIKFKEAVPVMVDSVEKLLYLYQVINSGEKPMLAWAGPYSTDKSKIETSGDWTGSDWDEWDNKTYRKLIQELEEEKNKKKNEELKMKNEE